MITRYPLRFIATVLADADTMGCPAAGRKHGVWPESVYRWWYRRMREPDGWPTQADIDADDAYRAATADHRASHAAQLARNRAQSYLRRGRPLYVPAVGTQRRIQALQALGWTGDDLGTHLGVTLHRVSHLALMKCPTVHPDTRAAVAAMYDALAMTIPTHRPAWVVARTRRTAAAKGWALPLAWDDDTMDDPDATPHQATRRAA